MSRCSRILDAQTALFLLAALIFLYYFLFIPPFIPTDHIGDGTILLGDGMRMYEGEVMYRDFFQYLTPGTALVFFFLFKLFGVRLWIPNLMALLLGLGLAWLGVVIAKKLMSPRLALLPSAIFLVGVRESLCDPLHHWFSLLTAMAAIAVLMEMRTQVRIAGAGFFCGLTACFTQSRGLAVVLGFGVFLWWESQQRRERWGQLLKKAAWLVAPFLATLIAVNAYFIGKAGLARFLWCTVIFGIKYYPKAADSNTFWAFKESFPAFVPLRNFLRYDIEQWLFLYAGIPLIFILFFASYWRESRQNPGEYWERPTLVAIVGAIMLLSIAPAPMPHRMAVSALPSLILLGWLLDSPRKLARALTAVFSAGVLLVAFHAVTRRQPTANWIFATPQGKFALADGEAYQTYTWIQQHTRPSDYLYEPAYPDQYFILNLRNPTPLPFVLTNGYTTTEQVAEVIRGLEQHRVRYIFWIPYLETIPKRVPPSDYHIGPLRDYVHSRYRLVKNFANSDEIWEKKD